MESYTDGPTFLSNLVLLLGLFVGKFNSVNSEKKVDYSSWLSLAPRIPLIMRTLDTKMEEDDLQMKWTLALLPLPQPSPLLVLLRRRKHDGTIMPVLDRVIFCQNLSDQ